jgi:hypothetical protein
MDINASRPAGRPTLRLPLQSAPIRRSQSAVSLVSGAGVEAATLLGFLSDLVHLDFQHMYDSVVDDVIDWVSS